PFTDASWRKTRPRGDISRSPGIFFQPASLSWRPGLSQNGGHDRLDADISDASLTFNHHRPRQQRIAYRMLGSWAEAEDVVQDAWLKWHAADHATLANIEAWLVSVTTRLSIDRLRSAKARRKHYIGAWLPEPDLTDLADAAPSPEQALEHAHDVS